MLVDQIVRLLPSNILWTGNASASPPDISRGGTCLSDEREQMIWAANRAKADMRCLRSLLAFLE